MKYKTGYKIPVPLVGWWGGVYMFHCIETDFYYIGSSVDLRPRLQEHNNLLKNNEHICKLLQEHYNNNYTFETTILYQDKRKRISYKILEYECIKYFYEHGYKLYNYGLYRNDETSLKMYHGNIR